MRSSRLGLAILAASAVLWPLGAARAVDHDYYVVAIGADQAVLVDRSTRARTGELVTMDLIILQRQPSQATGQATYWADGVQEVDCAGHRSRIMLVAALPLDRSRKFNSPGAAFRPWTANAQGSDGRAIEDFVCRDGVGPGIRMVADLTAFQRQYFSGDAGLGDRGDRSVADARSALQNQRTPPREAPPARSAQPAPPPPQPQAAPPAAPPSAGGAYYAFSRNDERVQLINRDQIVRGQGFATAPSVILMRTPIRDAGKDYYWVDATVQFDCAQNRLRTQVRAMYSLDRSARSDAQNAPFGEWTAVGNGSSGADVKGLVCDGAPPPGGRTVTDLAAFQRNYFLATATTPSPGQAQALALSATPQSARSSPVTPGAAVGSKPLKPYYVINASGESASVLVMADAVRANTTVTATNVRLLTKPVKAAGEDAYWVDGFIQIDCGKHQSRSMVTAGRPLDRSKRSAFPNAKYDAWEPIKKGDASADAEAILCNNRVPDGVIPVDDLTAFQKQFFAYAAQGKGR